MVVGMFVVYKVDFSDEIYRFYRKVLNAFHVLEKNISHF